MKKIKPHFQSIVLCLLLILMCLLFTGDYKVFFANCLEDENPVLYAYFFQDPARFAGDMFATWAFTTGFITLINWIPALLLKAVGLAPEFTVWMLAVLQNIFLGFALFRYSLLITGRNDVAWLSVFFAYTALPWQWNLAHWGDIMQMPYEPQFVLPFLIWAGSAAISGRMVLTAIILAFSGLIHPGLALYMVAFVGVFWVSQYAFKNWGKMAFGILILLVAAAFCYVPAKLLIFNNTDQLSSSELMEVLRRFIHAVPWKLSNWWDSLFTLVGFLVLTVLSFRKRKEVHPVFTPFFFSCLAASFLLALSQLFGIVAGIPQLVQLLGLRATALVPTFAFPLVLLYLIDKIDGEQFFIRWVSLVTVFLYVYCGWGVFLGCIVALFLWDFSEGCAGIAKVNIPPSKAQWLHKLTWIIFICWIALLLFTLLRTGRIAHIILQMLIPGGSSIPSPNKTLIILIFFCAFLAWACNPNRDPVRQLSEQRKLLAHVVLYGRQLRTTMGWGSLLTAICIIILIGFTMIRAWNIGEFTNEPFAKALCSAQLWARENTPENSNFITPLPWRVLSLRRKVSPVYDDSTVYSGSRLSKQHQEKLLEFYGLAENVQGKLGYEIASATRSAYLKLDEEGILRFRRQFGGDYIARRATQLPLKFPEAYKNDQIIIYKLP